MELTEKHYQHFDLESLAETLKPEFEVLDHAYLNKKSRATRIVRYLLVNRLFILNSPMLSRRIYAYYERSLLPADEGNANRLFALCAKA